VIQAASGKAEVCPDTVVVSGQADNAAGRRLGASQPIGWPLKHALSTLGPDAGDRGQLGVLLVGEALGGATRLAVAQRVGAAEGQLDRAHEALVLPHVALLGGRAAAGEDVGGVPETLGGVEDRPVQWSGRCATCTSGKGRGPRPWRRSSRAQLPDEPLAARWGHGRARVEWLGACDVCGLSVLPCRTGQCACFRS
jgi:hypothetical protein